MKPTLSITHEFVEFIPDKLNEGVVYVSIPYATAVHKCFCGCGQEIVTPITPTDWKLIFDGESVSLYPSIGNWNSKCQSHYWIRGDKVIWAERWTREQIDANRAYDKLRKDNYFEQGRKADVPDENAANHEEADTEGFWLKISKWIS